MTKKNSLSARKKDYSLFVSLERQREEKRIKKREKMRAKVAAARAAEREKDKMQVDGEDSKSSSENNTARKKSAQIAFGSRRRPHRKRFSKTRQRLLQKAKQERKNREEKRARIDTDDMGEVETAA